MGNIKIVTHADGRQEVTIEGAADDEDLDEGDEPEDGGDDEVDEGDDDEE